MVVKNDSGPSRPDRVSRALHDELAAMVLSELSDPRVAHVVISRVAMSPDLRLARVNIRMLHDADEKTRKTALAGLTSAAGFLRRELTKRLGLRFAPELIFHYDDGMDASSRVEELLDEVRRERSDK